MQGAGERAGGQESLVELEILVTADALDRVPVTVRVDHEDLIGPVHPGHRHRAIGDLVDTEEVDPSHAAARVTPRRRSRSRLRRPTWLRATCAGAPGRPPAGRGRRPVRGTRGR